MVVLALLPPTPLLLGAAVLVGLGMGPLSAMTAVLLGERIPERVRGRVMGLQNAAVLAMVPAGMLGAGLLVEATGVRTTGMLVAGLWLLVALGTLLAPALRTLEPLEVVPDADDR
jgi:MFS family permease